ncbi:hypothetical protein, partial [Pseudomonas sp. FEN]
GRRNFPERAAAQHEPRAQRGRLRLLLPDRCKSAQRLRTDRQLSRTRRPERDPAPRRRAGPGPAVRLPGGLDHPQGAFGPGSGWPHCRLRWCPGQGRHQLQCDRRLLPRSPVRRTRRCRARHERLAPTGRTRGVASMWQSYL